MPTSVLQSSIMPLGLSAVPIGGEPPVNKSLNFTVQHQRQTQWCWAAVTSSVAAYYKRSDWSQCRVVNVALGQAVCCGNGSSTECNKPWYLDKALDLVGNLDALAPQALPLQQIKGEIDANHPIGVRIGWSGGGGHFIAIGGYSENLVHVHDPWYGESSKNYMEVLTSYQGIGRWTHSYRTAPEKSAWRSN